MREKSHSCLVPGCPIPGHNQIGLRVRVAHSGASPFPKKRRTDAIFAIESAGYLCDQHSLTGGHFEVNFTPDVTHEASIEAVSGHVRTEVRSKPITQPLEEAA